MRIYLAARYSRRGELNQYANDLRSFGHTVDARWLLGNHENPANLEGNPVRDRVWALEDYEDVFRADLLIAFSEAPGGPGRKAGGRHVEMGLALAWGKEILVVGPRENVFHSMPIVLHYLTWEDAKPTLRDRGGGVRQTKLWKDSLDRGLGRHHEV